MAGKEVVRGNGNLLMSKVIESKKGLSKNLTGGK